MREVLISTRPRWVNKITRGIKKIEIRKTRPQEKTPFKCFIYETKGRDVEPSSWRDLVYYGRGKVVGEFICDKIEEFYLPYPAYFSQVSQDVINIIFDSCLTLLDVHHYIGMKKGYAWHISDLKIYDFPKKLSEFRKPFPFNKACVECERGGDSFDSEDCSCCEYWSDKDILEAPQSWRYVESKM